MMPLRPARSADLPAARTLLIAADLPVAGVADQFGSGYVVAEQDGEFLGLAGMELHASFGLLRSVAVSATARGQGLGEQLVRDRLAWAARHGVSRVYLLTLTAAGYFQRLGFVRVNRNALPPAIRRSREYSSICPESAVAMMYVFASVKTGRER